VTLNQGKNQKDLQLETWKIQYAFIQAAFPWAYLRVKGARTTIHRSICISSSSNGGLLRKL
jgi:hypothetical protein